jgi:hypothetical protein
MKMVKEMSLEMVSERLTVPVRQPGARAAELAEALAEDAAGHAREAGRQREYAELAQEMMSSAANDESRRELIRIAAWHYERCAAGFRQAVVSFESAAKIERKNRLELLKKAETMAELAMRAELAGLELKDDEKKKKGGLNDETG